MKKVLLLLCLVSFLFIETNTAQVRVKDSLALVDFYNTNNGVNWKNNGGWLTAAPVSQWFGVYVSANRVAEIAMTNNNVKGDLPASFGDLDAMKFLYLNSNKITGIPASFDSLSKLQYVFLQDNKLSSLPPYLSGLVQLRQLVLGGNLFTKLPASITQFPMLNYLEFDGMNITSVSNSLGNLTGLTNLILDNDHLDKLPESIGNLTHLVSLDIEGNNLSTLPSGVDQLTSLQQIHMAYNKFVDFPLALSRLGDGVLYYVYIDHNLLTGHLPYFMHRKPNNNNQYKPYRKINISSNYYTFDAGEYEMRRHIFNYHRRQRRQPQDDFFFAPQANIIVHQNADVLSVYAGGTLINNTYTWHMAGTTDSTVITGDSTFIPSSIGSYCVTVKNAVVGNVLTLYSDTITITTLKKSNGLPAVNRSLGATSEKQRMLLYPNPAKDNINVVINVAQNETAQLIITAANGRVLSSTSRELAAGTSTQSINVSSLAKGTYFMNIKTKEGTTALKFVKE